MLMEHYINSKRSGIIEPDTTENRARAIKWAIAYENHYGIKIKLSLKTLTRNIVVT